MSPLGGGRASPAPCVGEVEVLACPIVVTHAGKAARGSVACRCSMAREEVGVRSGIMSSGKFDGEAPGEAILDWRPLGKMGEEETCGPETPSGQNRVCGMDSAWLSCEDQFKLHN
jgi:hypothetical protein